MKRMLLLLAAGALAVPVFAASRPAVAAEALAAPAQAAPADGAPSAEAPAATAPAMEQRRRVRTYHHRTYRPSSPRHVRTYRHTYRTYRPTHYYRPYYRSYYYHYTPPVVYTTPTVVVQPEPIYVEEPVVVQEPVAYASPTPVVYEAPEEVVVEEDDGFGATFIVSFVGVNESDTDLAFETIEHAGLLGGTGAIRFALDPHWGMEAGIGLLGSEDSNGVQQLSLPLSLSVMAHLFPNSIVDPFGIAGLDVIFNEYDDPAMSEVEHYTQFAGHLGFGAEVNLGDNFVISADLRFLFMNARPEREELLVDYGASAPDGVSVRDGEAGTLTTTVVNEDPDDLSTALQFQIGAGWRF